MAEYLVEIASAVVSGHDDCELGLFQARVVVSVLEVLGSGVHAGDLVDDSLLVQNGADKASGCSARLVYTSRLYD